jgi:tetratricopeptide (TPR) repeat protein
VFPKSGGFCNTRGQALEAGGQVDSAIAAYKACAALAPTDPRPSLLAAATILSHTVYDTLHAPKLPDSVALKAYQNAFGDKVDAAKPFIQPSLAGADTALRINAAALLLTGGSAMARAGAYWRAYPWLDQLLTIVQPATPADTLGPKQQIRVQGSFWFGLSSTLTLGELYSKTVKDKSCEEAKEMSERISRTRDALFLGGRVAPTVATQMLGILGQYSKALGSVKAAFKCTNF